jgi:uncharacterized protein (DUF433 family)
MATLDWSQCPAVESIPGKVSGAWVLRGTRTPVKVLFENLEAGMSIEEVIEQFPVTREQLESLTAFVARSLDKAPSYRQIVAGMLVLFDNCTPRGLARFLTDHSVEEARARGWEELANGELIDAAEQAGFQVMVTTDKNIRYQQNFKARTIALVVLEHSQWPMVKLVAEKIFAAVNAAEPGSYVEVEVPFKE